MEEFEMTSSPAGWHDDPIGAHQLRYWDGTRWTEHVSDNGVQSVAPLTPTPPVPAQTPPAQTPPAQTLPAQTITPVGTSPTEVGAQRSGGRPGKWILVGLALAVAAAVAFVVVSNSSDDDTASGPGGAVDSGQSFCEDFSGTWSIVNGGMIAADTLIEQVATDPNYGGASTDTLNAVTQAAQDASVIAAESPAEHQEKISAMANFLGLAVQLAQGDTSVTDDMISLGVSSEDSAYLLGTVPFSTCQPA
jgi:hypothetical protein